MTALPELSVRRGVIRAHLSVRSNILFAPSTAGSGLILKMALDPLKTGQRPELFFTFSLGLRAGLEVEHGGSR